MKESTVQKETEISFGTIAGNLADWLTTVPRHAKISIRATPGDRPWESGQQFIKATWKE